MIETPLEIFLAGVSAGTLVTFLGSALACGSAHGHLDARLARLRRALTLIADLDAGPAGTSARNALTLDDRETADA